jgi:catechol 2,3-dioxygenase-like lactoylglutathione lyase family enzyme
MKDTGTHICQVAIVALDARHLRKWYQDTFGFLRAGKSIFFPPISTRVQGVPAFEKISWLIDGKDYFNLEFFQFLKPSSKARESNRNVADIGYNIMGIHVVEFDKVLEQSIALGGQRVSQDFGTVGQRRACIKDPEGNVIELFEQDPLEGDSKALTRPKIPATVRSMTISVPDLQQARKTYVEALGLIALDSSVTLHEQEHEDLWGLAGANCKRLLLRGGDFLVELVQYLDPEPKPWPQNYSICDQGYMNIVLGFSDKVSYDAAFEQAITGGMESSKSIT